MSSMGEGRDIQSSAADGDLKAERSLLGRLLASKDALADVLGIVDGEDFAERGHGLIFDVIVSLYGDLKAVDAVTVGAELARRRQAKAGGSLAELTAAAKGAPKATVLAERVRSAARLRELRAAAQQVADAVDEADAGCVDDVVDLAQSLFSRTSKRLHIGEPAVLLADLMEGALDELESIGSRRGAMSGIPTGFADLDTLTNGFHPGQLVVLASRPAVGKSMLALDWIRLAAIKHKFPTVLFTLESGRNDVAMRILAAESRVALHHMRTGAMTDEDSRRLARRIQVLNDSPLFVQDSGHATFTDIRAQSRRLVDQHDVRLIVIDQLQMLTYGTRPFASRYEEVSEISRCLKLLAKELNVPVLALSELNRSPENRADKRPMLSDLRDSGTLEENADLVILLHRDDPYERDSPRAGEADLIVAKHREGPTATITVAFQPHYARFTDMAPS
ncbi:replicative DNA helicase [Streptacidiphilus sp. MAP12-33]|uniref:replicative DNA helicase n=1 Tax=Streptacidiphilus sp. MAP12-33 TaxID=3156266 RepID=UPI0035183E55